MPVAKQAKVPKEASRKPAARKPLQKKLAVGAAGDRFEREADRVARHAVRGGGQPASIPPTISSLGAQRTPIPATRDDPPPDTARAVQRKPSSSLPRVDDDRRPAKRAQRQATDGGSGGTAPPSVESSIGRMQAGGGRALDGGARSLMEGHLGHDFTGVRVHHGHDAAAAAQALGARAFTVGRDVFFNAGQYQPHTTSGQKLIAHELTHTVQQGGVQGVAARKRIQRATTPGTGTTPRQDEEDAPAPASTTFRSRRLPGAAVDITPKAESKGTITLPVLGLPPLASGLKGTAGGAVTPVAAPGRAIPVPGAPFTLGPVNERDEGSRAYQVWTEHARSNFKPGVRAKLEQIVADKPDLPEVSAPGSGAPVFFLKFKKSKGHVYFGTLDQLSDQDALLRPQWNPAGTALSGQGKTLDADHFLELQIGGKDAADNMWLLKGSYNQAVGGALKTNIEAGLRTLLNEVTSDRTLPDTAKPASVPEMKRRWTLHFLSVAAGTGFGKAPADFWTATQIGAGVHLDQLKVMTERDLSAAGLHLENSGVQPRRITVFPTPGGGKIATVKLGPKGQVIGSTFLYRNVWALGGTYHGGATDQAEGQLLTLDVVINKTSRGSQNPIAEKRGTINVPRVPALGLAGYLSRDSITSQFAHMDFEPLSPLTFTDLGVNADGVLVGIGSVLSSKALFPGLNVPLVLYDDRIMMNFAVPTERLSLGPLSVTEAALSLGVATEGLFIEGYAGFAVTGLGSGTVTALADRRGPRLDGTFDLDTDFLNPAQITATYDLATDTLTCGMTLGVEQGRIPGVDSGTVTVGITRDAVDVAGTITLSAPLAGTVLTVGYTQQEGVQIGAENIPLPFSSIPSVQNATMSIAAARRPDGTGWSFGGTGQATLVVPGATGTINLRYVDGTITMTAVGQVSKGPASGTLNFTATNSPLDEQGNPVDGPPTTTVKVWGRGTVTIRFGRILNGTAGVELTPDNRVILTGEIALPSEFPVFDRVPYHRDLLRFAPPEFPIWGVSVAGVGVGIFAFVRGRVSFEAFVGPGVIRGAAIMATMDLDHPELATVQGHGEFYVPAYAGLTLGVSGGLRARAGVAFAEGEVGLEGTLGVAADASASLDVDWSPTSGLTAATQVAANVRPKFRLDATAQVKIGVDLWVTDVSKTFGPWRKMLGEFGPDMELGVAFPVRWSEAGGLDLSLDNIVVRQPTLDPSSLMSGVFDRLSG